MTNESLSPSAVALWLHLPGFPSIKLQCGAEMEGRLGGCVALYRKQAHAAWIIRFRQLTLITTDSSKI